MTALELPERATNGGFRFCPPSATGTQPPVFTSRYAERVILLWPLAMTAKMESSMAGFTHFSREAKEIELEIERNGIALGIDWEDEEQVRSLAREALHYHSSGMHLSGATDEGRTLLTKVELFGLAGLMLKTMTESAEVGVETHGGVVWKSLGKALLDEQKLLPPDSPAKRG